ncbi:MAG TPA: glycerophosphodiester phosphodiesterase family protein [Devosiaceae bacterium]
MKEPTFVVRDGHRAWLKWHRARRRRTDAVFTGARIREGMAIGASIEVDLVVHADHGFAVLHDEVLGREATGNGPVAQASAESLRAQFIIGNDGRPTTEPVRLLEDLAGLLADTGIHPDALLQLDYKLDARALTPQTIDGFAQSVAPVAGHMILSSGDAASVRLLCAAAPGIRVGYDPCHDGALERVSQSRDFEGFVNSAVISSPDAELIYLAHPLITGAAAMGFDMVAAFHAQGRRVDAYTIATADAAGLTVARRLLELRVDQITTDDPEALAAALDGDN